jgi:hypothetical protein
MKFNIFLFLLFITGGKSFGQIKIQRFPEVGFKIECETQVETN